MLISKGVQPFEIVSVFKSKFKYKIKHTTIHRHEDTKTQRILKIIFT